MAIFIHRVLRIGHSSWLQGEGVALNWWHRAVNALWGRNSLWSHLSTGLSFVWLLTGFCGLFCPMCLECDIARHYGECFCWPLLPGSTFALRVGIRERHKIWVSVFECMCEPGSVWESGCLSNLCRFSQGGLYYNADYRSVGQSHSPRCIRRRLRVELHQIWKIHLGWSDLKCSLCGVCRIHFQFSRDSVTVRQWGQTAYRLRCG